MNMTMSERIPRTQIALNTITEMVKMAVSMPPPIGFLVANAVRMSGLHALYLHSLGIAARGRGK